MVCSEPARSRELSDEPTTWNTEYTYNGGSRESRRWSAQSPLGPGSPVMNPPPEYKIQYDVGSANIKDPNLDRRPGPAEPDQDP
jgi:hypothetical protein